MNLLKEAVTAAVVTVVLLAALEPSALAVEVKQNPAVLHLEGESTGPPPARPAVPPPPSRTIVEDGFICEVIDFEGLADESLVPEFDGITSPGWLALIDSDVGGTGNFAFEPSPETIAFWLEGDPGSRDIDFDSPVAKVSFFYASAVTVTLEAFDADGNLLDSVSGDENYDQGPGGDPTGEFNQWDPLEVEVDENLITRVRVSGNVNQTGIDDLEVCRQLRIHSVEMTQAIQEWQEIEDLLADLEDDFEPPVPIVEGKPAVLRVYTQQVASVSTVRMEFDIPFVTRQSRSVTLQPQCTPELRRRRENGCLSLDFYFVPPSWQWTATLRLFDENDVEVEEHMLEVASRDADTLALRAVSICDNGIPIPPFGTIWQCADARDLDGLVGFLERTVPTDRVTVNVTNHRVRLDTDDYDTDGDGTLSREEMRQWWIDSVREVGNLFGLFDALVGLFGEHRYYYGMVLPDVPGGTGGMADGIPSRGAQSRTSALRLGVETNDELVAHEAGHMFDRQHTNTEVPEDVGGSPPGCYSLAPDNGTDWPYADNRIQSDTRLEVGFDVTGRSVVLPEDNFDWMSYCTPRWIAPFTYRHVMDHLDDPPLPREAFGYVVFGPFWAISGIIDDTEAADLDPLFTFEVEASTDPGSGPYRIEVRDTVEAALFTRFFTPSEPITESGDGSEIGGFLVFFELVPVQAGAARIVLLDDGDNEIGGFTLGGAAPTVALSHPLGGEAIEGIQEISWTIDDSDSLEHTSRVEYSWDGGETWASLGKFRDQTTLDEDFDQLPGSDDSSLIRVWVSDGINTGSAVSGPFSVGTKAPTAEILHPAPDTVFALLDLVWLRGSAYDRDDGFLDGEAVAWESSLDGPLGTGASLPITTLSQGEHEIVFSATDSEGKQASASVALVVAGGPPTLDLTVVALDQLPTRCVEVTIDAQPAPESVDLAAVEYSLDGGTTWIPVPLDELPLRFIVPGSGFFHLVSRATDAAGQVAAADERFFIDSPCPNSPPTADAGDDQIVECSGPDGAAVTLDGSASADPDGDPLSYEWRDGDDNVVGTEAVVEVVVSPGTFTFTLRADDGKGGVDSDSVEITVEGTSPPTIDLISAAPDVLWPPNHKMVPVEITVEASDVCDTGPPLCQIVEVRSSQPVVRPGDTKEPDWLITGQFSVDLRAERLGKGNDRVYTVFVECTDSVGNVAMETVEVVVPHDQGRRRDVELARRPID